MTTFEEQVLADLATLKTQMRALMGNGQPGRLQQIEARVERHEGVLQRAIGVGGFLGCLITLVHFALDAWRIR